MENEKIVDFTLLPKYPLQKEIAINIDTTFVHESRDIKKFGIHTYYYNKPNIITPHVADNGNLVLFFKGRIFFQDEMDSTEQHTAEEYIIDIYKKYGFQYLLKKLNGVFTFILLDQSYEKEESLIYVVTDRFGLIPMYYKESDTNIIEFSTVESNQNQVAIPAASYSKLYHTNKVSSIWSFDREESVPTFDHIRKQWIYPKRKFRYYKYRTFYGGQYPFDIDYIEHTDNQLNTRVRDSIARTIEKYLYRAFQLRLYNFEQYEIYCVGNPYDKEFLFMKSMLAKILENYPTSMEIDSVQSHHHHHHLQQQRPLFHSVYVKSLQDKESQDYLELLLNPTEKDRPIIIFASSGLVIAEEIKAEEQWLAFYMSILPRIRYEHSLNSILSNRLVLT